MSGYGSGSYGSSSYGSGGGGGPAAPFAIAGASPVSENVVRVTFTAAVNFTGLGDPGDAANAAAYAFSSSGGIGLDGSPPRAIAPATVAAVDGDPASVDVTLDRSMSPYPCTYTVAVQGVASELGDLISYDDFGFIAVQNALPPPAVDVPTSSRDIAHPDTLSAALDPLPDAGKDSVLGSIPKDASGDYAYDEGVVGYKKRVFRRLLSDKDGFAHLPGYGAGLRRRVKRLASSSERQAIAADCEKQVLLEPETVRCRVTISPSNNPGLFRLVLLIQTKQWGAVKFDHNIAGT